MSVACGRKTEVQPPEIPQNAIDMANDTIRAYDEVRDSFIKVDREEKKITLSIQVSPLMSVEQAKDMGENLARMLASYSRRSDEIERGPTRDYLGEIYDHYRLSIVVGSSSSHIIVWGVRAASSHAALKIRWQ